MLVKKGCCGEMAVYPNAGVGLGVEATFRRNPFERWRNSSPMSQDRSPFCTSANSKDPRLTSTMLRVDLDMDYS